MLSSKCNEVLARVYPRWRASRGPWVTETAKQETVRFVADVARRAGITPQRLLIEALLELQR
jgi:hypothetical protein